MPKMPLKIESATTARQKPTDIPLEKIETNGIETIQTAKATKAESSIRRGNSLFPCFS
jgi:hypothetical protein